MKSTLPRLFRLIRVFRLFCHHEFEWVKDMKQEKDDEGKLIRVRCSCRKCGKPFYAPYGLALLEHGKLIYTKGAV